MRKKLFIGAVLIIALTPVFLLGRWVYGNRQVSERAKILYDQITKYPNSTYVSSLHSIYSLGYGEQYKVSDDPETVLSFYKSSLSNNWKFKERSDVSNSKGMVFTYQDLLLDISVDSNNDPIKTAKPPYNLNIDISQIQN